jgi:hypothetical protein
MGLLSVDLVDFSEAADRRLRRLTIDARIAYP